MLVRMSDEELVLHLSRSTTDSSNFRRVWISVSDLAKDFKIFIFIIKSLEVTFEAAGTPPSIICVVCP